MLKAIQNVITALAAAALVSACSRADVASGDSTGASSPAEWKLVEEVRIGGDEAGPSSFSVIHSIVATSNGNIFILEKKDQELRVFDRSGTFVRIAARSGQGPGEIQYGTGLAVSHDTVWVSDPGNARFSSFDRDGRFIAQITITSQGFGDVWRGVADDSGRIVDLPVRIPQGGVDPRTKYPITKDHIRFIRTNGSADTVSSPVCGPDAPTYVFKAREYGGYITSVIVPFTTDQMLAVTANGMVWCSPATDYRLSVGSIGGAIREVVNRDVVRVPLTDAQKRDAQTMIEQFEAKVGPLVDSKGAELPKHLPAVAQLHVDTEGRAWVRATSTPDSTPSLDVFDQDGRMLAQVQSQAPLGRSLFITAHHLYSVAMDEDEVPVVVRYRIKR
jgi:hypothetical protein